MQLEDYHENAKDTDLVRMPRCENEDFVNLMAVLRTKMQGDVMNAMYAMHCNE